MELAAADVSETGFRIFCAHEDMGFSGGLPFEILGKPFSVTGMAAVAWTHPALAKGDGINARRLHEACHIAGICRIVYMMEFIRKIVCHAFLDLCFTFSYSYAGIKIIIPVYFISPYWRA